MLRAPAEPLQIGLPHQWMMSVMPRDTRFTHYSSFVEIGPGLLLPGALTRHPA
jgi:hypothetical protein